MVLLARSNGKKTNSVSEYDRTLFLLWRTSEDFPDPLEIRYTRRYASWALQSSSSTTPSKRELLLVDSIQADRKANTEEEKRDEGVNALCKCAIQWSDLTMLLTTLEKNAVSANLDLIGVENCAAAYRAFGWDALKILCVFSPFDLLVSLTEIYVASARPFKKMDRIHGGRPS